MLNINQQAHSLAVSLRGIAIHGAITLLAVAIAFSLPEAAKYILYKWWPMVESDPNLLLGSEIVLASVLVLILNLAKLAWDHRYTLQMARTAALVYARLPPDVRRQLPATGLCHNCYSKGANMNRMKKHIVAVLVAVTLSAGVPPPQAFANIIATDAVVAATARNRIAQALSRAEVSERLIAYGVDPTEVETRVGALTDQEAVQLADRIDALPAGGNALIGALVFVFLVLLITDILGLTKIFPFTRPVR